MKPTTCQPKHGCCALVFSWLVPSQQPHVTKLLSCTRLIYNNIKERKFSLTLTPDFTKHEVSSFAGPSQVKLWTWVLHMSQSPASATKHQGRLTTACPGACSDLEGTIQQAHKLLVLLAVQLSARGADVTVGGGLQVQTAGAPAAASPGVQLAQQV